MPVSSSAFTADRLLNGVHSFAIAICTLTAAFGARLLLDPFLQNLAPMVTFFPAVAFIAWKTNLPCSLFSIGTSILIASYFFIEPRYSFGVGHPADWVLALSFLVASSVVVVVVRTERRSRIQLQSQKDQARKLAEELQRSEQLQLLGLKLANAVAFEWHPATDQVLVAGDSLFLTGGSPLPHNNATYVQWIYPEDRERLVQTVKSLTPGKPHYTSMYRVNRPDGKTIWVEETGLASFDDEGRMERLIGISRDATRQVEIEARLRASEQAAARRAADLAAVIDATSTPMAYFDRDFNFEWANVAFAETCRRRPQELVGHNLFQMYPHQSNQRLFAEVRDSGRSCSQSDQAYTFPDQPDRGITFWDWSLVPVKNDPDTVVGLVLSLRETTERKRILEEIEHQRNSFMQLAENSPDIITRVDRDLRHVYVNRAVETATGIPAEAFVGKKIAEMGMPDHLLRLFHESYQRVFVHQEKVRIEFSFVHPDGSTRFFDLLLVPEFGRDGAVTTALGIARDHTEEKKAVTALLQAKEELAQTNADLEERVRQRTHALQELTDQLNSFVYTLAHDLRAPLRSQMGFASVLLEDYGEALGETGRGYARHIVDSAERQGLLLSDLLKHISLSREDLPLQNVDLRLAVELASRDLLADINQRGALLDTTGVRGCVVANGASLHLIVTNLLSNAMKFVAPGVKPAIRVWTETPSPVDASSPTARLRLVVEDNGLGIAPDCLPKLFELFNRFHAGPHYPGTGIGLAIVKKAAERMGGRVGVESSPGHGSRFWVELPTLDAPDLPVRRAGQQAEMDTVCI